MKIRISNENSKPFNFVNRDKKLEKLVAFWPGGQKMCQRGVIQNAARQALKWAFTQSIVQFAALVPLLRLIEPQVRASYPDTLDSVTVLGDTQLMQMAEGSCLFLLVAFTLLGLNLGFPSQHVILDHGHVNKNKEMWIRSIFFVGNQIPFYMVDMLMESSSILRDCRTMLRASVPPSDLLELTLFEFVTRDSRSATPTPFDVMHCLRSIILKKLESSFLPSNSQPGNENASLPSVVVNSEMWPNLIKTSLNEFETVQELQHKVSESLHHLIWLKADVQAPPSREVIAGVNVDLPNVTPRRDPNLPLRKVIQSCKFWLYYLWKYKKWLFGILIMIKLLGCYKYSSY